MYCFLFFANVRAESGVHSDRLRPKQPLSGFRPPDSNVVGVCVSNAVFPSGPLARPGVRLGHEPHSDVVLDAQRAHRSVYSGTVRRRGQRAP